MSTHIVSPLLDGWLTTAEAAAYLKTKPRTLLQWVREGAIRAYALHGTKRRTWRFLEADLDAALLLTASSPIYVLDSKSSSVVRQ